MVEPVRELFLGVSVAVGCFVARTIGLGLVYEGFDSSEEVLLLLSVNWRARE